MTHANYVQHTKTGLKAFNNKDIYISYIGNQFIGFSTKLTKNEQQQRFLQCRKAVNISEWSIVYGYKKPGINNKEFPISEIREQLINELLN